VLGLISWYFDWPAYVIIFWTLLSVLEAAINLLAWPITALAARE